MTSFIIAVAAIAAKKIREITFLHVHMLLNRNCCDQHPCIYKCSGYHCHYYSCCLLAVVVAVGGGGAGAAAVVGGGVGSSSSRARGRGKALMEVAITT